MNGRLCEIYSLGALLLSQFIWWFMDGQVYTACAYGPEYTLIFDGPDWSFPIVISLAIGLSLAGLGCALGAACQKPKRKLYILLLVATNIYVSPLGWLEMEHTGATTDYADLQK